MGGHPAGFTTRVEAHEEAGNRLLVWRVASKLRCERGVPECGIVCVTLHDKDEAVLFAGEVR